LVKVICSAFLHGKLAAKLFDNVAKLHPFPKYVPFIVLRRKPPCIFYAAGSISVLFHFSYAPKIKYISSIMLLSKLRKWNRNIIKVFYLFIVAYNK